MSCDVTNEDARCRYYRSLNVTFLAALYMLEVASCVYILSAERPHLEALLHTLLHLSCVIHTVCTGLAGRSFSFIFLPLSG